MLVRFAEEAIRQAFTPEDLARATVMDVGCYDGWLLEQLSRLPVARLVGVEPRAKNIEKGQVVRRVLGLPSRVEYRVGDVDALGGERFDVVICAGLLHHLESHASALRQLGSVCRRLLFLETICLSSRFATEDFLREMEMKDVVYQYEARAAGISGQKLESSYYDGSASRLSVVNIPSVESLHMYLQLAGFRDIRIVADPESYSAALWGDRRPMRAVALTAVRVDESASTESAEETWIRDYESGLIRTTLPLDVAEEMCIRLCEGRRHRRLPATARLALRHVRAGQRRANRYARLLNERVADPHEREILKNLRFVPGDKARLEYGKALLAEGRAAEAVAVLEGITRRPNADWRSAYRAMFLLVRAHEAAGNEAAARRYEDLCRTCNPRFPFDLLMRNPAGEGQGDARHEDGPS